MTDHSTTRIARPPARSGPSFDDHGGSAPQNYERYFVPAIGAPLARHLVEAASLTPGERVLDIACGTGVVARLAADRVGASGAVTGLDVNAGMLAVARSIPAAGPPIDWREAPAEATGLADAGYDVALCQMGLQFFADRGAALGDLRRVLAPGGRLVASVPGPTPAVFAILEQALRDHLSAGAARFVAIVFSLHEAGELRGLLDEARFDDVRIRRRTETLRLPPPGEFLWQYVSSTPLAAAVADLSGDERDALQRHVVAGWEPFTEDGGLVLELGLAVAEARAR